MQLLKAPTTLQRNRRTVAGIHIAAIEVIDMAKIMRVNFESWIRDRSRCCMEPHELDELCWGDMDVASGAYTFVDAVVQGQWEAWQAACESAVVARI